MGKKLTLQEKIELVFNFFSRCGDTRLCSSRIQLQFILNKNNIIVCRLIKRFQETGLVADRERQSYRKLMQVSMQGGSSQPF